MSRGRTGALVAVAAVALGGCSRGNERAAVEDERARGDGRAAGTGAPLDRHGDVRLPPPPPVPSPAPGLPPLPPTTPSFTAEQVALGELLFFEARLGADGTTRCASCHDPDQGFAGIDPLSKNALGKLAPRHTPTLLDLAWHPALGWDGRGTDPVRFVMAHVTTALGVALDDSAPRLLDSPTYRAHVRRAGSVDVAARVAGQALTAYALTRYSRPSAWDRHLGGDREAVTAAAVAGQALFEGKARCATCHPAPLYTDHAYRALGLIALADDGRGRVEEGQSGRFKTPGLRAAALRRRFFHDGSAASLDLAVDWHIDGGVGQGAARAAIDPELQPVTLTVAERAALIAFVRALSPSPQPFTPPTLPQDLP